MLRRRPKNAAVETAASPFEIYGILLKRFGPQGWWPVTRKGALVPEYRPRNYRRDARERFEICVGAILTQNTAWTNVEKALANLHGAGVLDPEKLCRIPQKKLARLIQPSGYYNQKAERLKIIAEFFGGGKMERLFARPLNAARAELLAVKGIGPETADSILLYAANKRSFVVDAYTQRIGRRLGWFDRRDYGGMKAFFERRLPPSLKVYNEMHALIVRLCKDFCRKTPACAGCPLHDRCAGKTVSG